MFEYKNFFAFAHIHDLSCNLDYFLACLAAARESLEEGDMTLKKEKISAEWLADLQHTHENEIKTTSDLIVDKVFHVAQKHYSDICLSISEASS